MTNQQHPITPPPKLLKQWRDEAPTQFGLAREAYLTTHAAQWGADQELEACCKWLRAHSFSLHVIEQLRIARRPKPPNLKEQALTALHAVATGANDTGEQHQDLDTIRQALEALPND